MPNYDPFTDRYHERRDQELELLRAEVNKLASERDYLNKKVQALELIREQQRNVIDRLRANLRTRHERDHQRLLGRIA